MPNCQSGLDKRGKGNFRAIVDGVVRASVYACHTHRSAAFQLYMCQILISIIYKMECICSYGHLSAYKNPRFHILDRAQNSLQAIFCVSFVSCMHVDHIKLCFVFFSFALLLVVSGCFCVHQFSIFCHGFGFRIPERESMALHQRVQWLK